MVRHYPSGVRALTDVSREPLGLEFAAALYESYVSDVEAFNTWPTHAVPDAYMVMDRYANAAQRAAESVERSAYERLDAAIGLAW